MTNATLQKANELDHELVVTKRNLENLRKYCDDPQWDTNESVAISLGFPGLSNYLFLEITKEDLNKALISYYEGKYLALEKEFEEL